MKFAATAITGCMPLVSSEIAARAPARREPHSNLTLLNPLNPLQGRILGGGDYRSMGFQPVSSAGADALLPDTAETADTAEPAAQARLRLWLAFEDQRQSRRMPFLWPLGRELVR